MLDDQDKVAAVEPVSGRLCGYSGCRAPLPISSGPGNRPRYCQDGNTWGDRNVSCKQAGHAEELLASINAPVTPAPTASAELAERIGVLLEPTRQLVTALEQTREQLESETAAARQERDEALATAAEERGLREVAETRASENHRYAQECNEVARRATADAERAEERASKADIARQDAEHAQLRAEARAEELVEQLRRTDERLQAATGYAEDVDRKLAGSAAQLSELRGRLDEERERAEAERARAHDLVAEHHNQVEQIRASGATQTAELRRVHDRERSARTERHEAAVAQLHEQLGRVRQQLTDERRRTGSLGTHLDRWQSGLSELIQWAERSVAGSSPVGAQTGQTPGDDLSAVDLIGRMQALLNEDNRWEDRPFDHANDD